MSLFFGLENIRGFIDTLSLLYFLVVPQVPSLWFLLLVISSFGIITFQKFSTLLYQCHISTETANIPMAIPKDIRYRAIFSKIFSKSYILAIISEMVLNFAILLSD